MDPQCPLQGYQCELAVVLGRTRLIDDPLVDHPAIGEAIDEDASGFLSIQEVNNFLTKRPEKYSTPQWLVLCVLSLAIR